MPRLSTFYGIVIAMYYSDHNPPHFHALYAGQEAQVRIADGEVIRGQLPPRALALVREWAGLRRSELQACWDRARIHEPLGSIAPLD